MNIKRRKLIYSLASFALLCRSGFSNSQVSKYPNRTIKLIVPFAAGGSTDLLARVVAQKLGDRLGQPIVVDNRPGVGAMLGSSFVAKAPPDGYTLLMGVTSALVFGPLMSKQQLYDPLKDFTPISRLVNHPSILIVHPSVKANTIAELVALAKGNPGKFNFGSQGNGTTAHLAGERFNIATGANIVHVPYKGAAPAMADLLAGRIHMLFDSASTALPHIKSGGVRAVAIAGRSRFFGLPDLPTIAEAGYPGFDMASWNALLGPAGLPKDIVTRLGTEITNVFSDPVLREKLLVDGIEPIGGDAAELTSHMNLEMKTWEPVVRNLGLYQVN
jgi:tripartite-type tricarboxylate transporter receptor subunit TctC